MLLGCDIGTSVTKAVLLEEGRVACSARTATQASPDKALENVLEIICRRSELKPEDLPEMVVTGWGQGRLSVPHRTQPMMNCLARAAIWDMPNCRSVLCMGAQQSLVLSLNERGRVLEYRANDKCAAGAGKFLEVILEALDCRLEDSVRVARAAQKKLAVTSQCAVFAETEVVSLVHDGESVSDIAKAIFEALSKSFISLCKKIRLQDGFVIGGGIANNSMIVEMLEQGLGTRLHVFRPEPDLLAAVGAALGAKGQDR